MMRDLAEGIGYIVLAALGGLMAGVAFLGSVIVFRALMDPCLSACIAGAL